MEPTLQDKIEALINQHGAEAVAEALAQAIGGKTPSTNSDPVPPNPTHP